MMSTQPCIECGMEVPKDAVACEICGCNFIRGVVLSTELGKIEIRSNTELGQGTIRQIVGDDARFFSVVQFSLVNSQGQGWLLVPAQKAKNQTFLNGSSVDKLGHVLGSGDVISLKDRVGAISVSLIRD